MTPERCEVRIRPARESDLTARSTFETGFHLECGRSRGNIRFLVEYPGLSEQQGQEVEKAVTSFASLVLKSIELSGGDIDFLPDLLAILEQHQDTLSSTAKKVYGQVRNFL